VQLDGIGGHAALAMAIVPKPDSYDVHAYPGTLPRGTGVEARHEGPAHGLDGRQEGARRADTLRGGNLGNHRPAPRIAQDQVHVGILFDLVPQQDGVDGPHRRFDGSQTAP
jgi:hypothetical protein